MSPIFRWDTLQLHHGSPENSFELLCALLAERDHRFVAIADGRFVRNGRPDGGVECYWELPDGTSHGYQAKFHRSALGKSQWDGLDESIKKALAAYPRMTGMTVCLPQDLPNSPKPRVTTSRQTWEQRKARWEEEGRRTRSDFTIDLWGDMQIAERLATPANTDLLSFFFDAAALTPCDIARHVQEQTARVGPRYQPQLHVKHGLEPLFDWLTMTESFRNGIVEALGEARKLVERPELRVLAPSDDQAAQHFAAVLAAFDGVLANLRACPVRSLWASVQRLDDALYKAVFALLRQHDPDFQEDTRRLPESERFKLRESWRRLHAITDVIADRVAILTEESARSWVASHDSRFVAITGSGGCGKTHLLCEMARQVSVRRHPVVLLLGQSLNARNWRSQCQVAGCSTLEDVLRSLNAAGAINGCRSLLMIDALNEADDAGAWEAELRALGASLRSYPHVAVVVTVRDSYAHFLLPPSQDDSSPERVEHDGFEADSSLALRVYCRHYNIALPDVPALHPEFGNPLFLSMFCQAVAGDPDPSHSRPAVPFPGGHLGFGQVFDHFIRTKERGLIQRYELDRDSSRTPLRDAIAA